jgi:hypothetical protein
MTRFMIDDKFCDWWHVLLIDDKIITVVDDKNYDWLIFMIDGMNYDSWWK